MGEAEESIQEENDSQGNLEAMLVVGDIVKVSYEEENGKFGAEEEYIIVEEKDAKQYYGNSTPILSDSPLGIALLKTGFSKTGKERIIKFVGGRGLENTIKIHRVH